MEKHMFLEITGFLADDCEDSSIKFELDVRPEFEKKSWIFWAGKI